MQVHVYTAVPGDASGQPRRPGRFILWKTFNGRRRYSRLGSGGYG
eukprot:SAG31_NODE_47193_length_251_cov_0.828947_1_plen_44_part_01